MLPKPDFPPPESLFLKKPKYHLLTIYNYIIAHPRTWLLLIVFSLQLLLLLLVRSLPVSTVSRHHFPSPTPVVTTATATATSCDSGKVFVYDLPPVFNKQLSEECDALNPWNSRCDALSNDGFGTPAPGLAGLVPENLDPAWYSTDQFTAEIIYHNRMLSHRCRTVDPDSATAFYVPFYAGLAVGKYLWSSNYTARDRDRLCGMLLEWLDQQESWKRSYGWDHFMMLGRITWDFRRSKDDDWGGSFLYMPGMKNVTRLLIERNPWDELDIGVPYPTGFHPRTESDIREWQDHVRNRSRTTLFCFAGGTRSEFKNDFRGILLDQCDREKDACRAVDCSGTKCSNGSSSRILELFLDSNFCLQPRGDSFTRRSIFDCMIAGSIPVFFWRRTAYLQYKWHLPEDPESYSVFIDRRAVSNGTSIRAVLEGLGEERVKRMKDKIVEYIPKFVYAAPKEGLAGMKDAFDVSLEGVLRRFQEQRRT
ncbi:xyloglucan galactosyltransferase XLT2 [Magnolia sinica]|uniref:xyloglucan galactosyltransferase XLT2 n=1 Tax=Magnolia sinica TaxID=86752 RepID=UPI002657DCB3|nr:xyloglucan galactosyltransferase XLT2 [Magnolia sinica]